MSSTRNMEVRTQGSGGASSEGGEDDGEDVALDDGNPANISQRSLAHAFGAAGSWFLCGALPPGGLWGRQGEVPFHIRDMQAYPTSLKRRAVQCLLNKWGAAVLNTKGCKGGHNAYCVGQDNFCLARLASGWEVVGVFDGHGSVGHWPSARLSRTIPFLLQGRRCSQLLAAGDAGEALRYAVLAAETDLEAQAPRERVDLRASGSTLVVALRHAERDRIWVATVGDSRATLFTASGEVVAETSDHKPARRDERARIESMGGAVVQSRYSSDHRVYIKGTEFPGIAVSRSMGDCGVKAVGVTAEPEVVSWPAEGLQEDGYLLLCSDGVWEFLKTEDATRIVGRAMHQGGSPLEALQQLLDASKAKWRHHCGSTTYCDDITMVLAPVSCPQAPRWDSLNLEEVENPVKAFLRKQCSALSCEDEGSLSDIDSTSDDSSAGSRPSDASWSPAIRTNTSRSGGSGSSSGTGRRWSERSLLSARGQPLPAFCNAQCGLQ